MKTILLCALLLGAFAVSAGQLTIKDGRAKYAAVNPFPGSSEHANIVSASSDPFRKVDGASVDLLPLFRYAELAASREQPAKRPLGNWILLKGKVIQAKAGDGILVHQDERDGLGKIVFLRRYAFSVVDEDYIVEFVCSAGTHQYTSVAGSLKTVDAFDYGTVIRGKEAEEMAARNGAKTVIVADESAAKDSADKRKKAEVLKAGVAKFKGVKLRAENGSVEAIKELAELYRKGIGTDANEAEALKWEAKADALK